MLATEKKLVKKGADLLRGAAETGVDGLADTALTSLGVPEFAPMADKLIDKGASYLEKKGVDYLDHKSHKGIPAPAGGVLARGLDSVGV